VSIYIKILIGGLMLAATGWLGYDYGVSKTEADHAETERQKNAVLAELSVRNAQLDAERTAALQRQNEERVRTVIKYRDRFVARPDRGCGFDADERVLVRAAYCAAYPDHPDCVQADLPAGADLPGNPGRGGPQGLGN